MIIAKIKVDGVTAVVTELSKIPKGIQGATIEVTYGDTWNSLKKTAVFSGCVVKDVVNPGTQISIPPEVVSESGYILRIGFYGVDDESKLIIPTLWAELGTIQSATDTSGDSSTNPSLPVWAQIQAEVEKLKAEGGVSTEQIQSAVQDYLERNPPQGVSDEYIREVTAAMLEEAKASGEFDGKPGKDGAPGKDGVDGQPGKDGADYVLTEADKEEIAGIAIQLFPIYQGEVENV